MSWNPNSTWSHGSSHWGQTQVDRYSLHRPGSLYLAACFPQVHGSSDPWDVCTLISLAYDAALIRALLQVAIYPGKLSDLIPHLLTNRTT